MSEEKIKIKGENDGLMLEFPPDLSFLEIVEELSRKLDSGSGFFLRGTLVRVPRNRFSKEELAELQELFRTHGLICRLEKPVPMRSASPVPPSPKPAAASVSPQEAMQDAPELQRMLVIDKTLRGGQAVETEGSVIVFGNVNPGAQITAGRYSRHLPRPRSRWSRRGFNSVYHCRSSDADADSHRELCCAIAG